MDVVQYVASRMLLNLSPRLSSSLLPFLLSFALFRSIKHRRTRMQHFVSTIAHQEMRNGVLVLVDKNERHREHDPYDTDRDED